MTILSKQVTARVGKTVATVQYFSDNDCISISINGVMTQFPTSANGNYYDGCQAETLKALAEAVGEL